MSFAGKTVIVTGAAGNLGHAVAKAFGESGANLVLAGRSLGSLEKVFGPKQDAKRMLAAVDLLDRTQVDAMVLAACERFGKVDVLANIAGGFRMGELVHETSEETWNFLHDINVRTLLNTVRAVVPRMLQGGAGKIVNVGAFAAQKGAARMGAYVAAKAAVIRLTETLALELREKNINVNCVLPTILDTPENRAAMPSTDPRRWVSAADLARVILFLASDEARAIHGAALPVTGLS